MRLLQTYQPRALSFNALDSLLEEGFPFFRNLSSWVAENQALAKLSVQESDGAYDIRLETPGYQKDQISVSLKEGVLTVKAQKYADEDKKQLASSLQRSVLLAKAVEVDEVEAKYSDGVLRLHLPKQEKAQTRRIQITG